MKKQESFFHRLKFYFIKKFKNQLYFFYKEPKPEKWLFILGCYNSGTTLLHKILSEHPEIGSMPKEGQEFTTEFKIPAKHGLPRQWALKPEIFYLSNDSDSKINTSKIKRQWAVAYNFPNRKILMEKTIANTARICWLLENFPNSYFIALIRNGYAVAEGIRRKQGHPIANCIKQWKVSNEILIRDIEQAENKIIIFYEDFVNNPKFVVDKICENLGIEPIKADILGKEFSVQKVESKIKNMNEVSFNNLSSEDIKIINEEAGDLLEILKYKLL